MHGYDPYTYRPMMRYFYNGGPLPQDVAIAAQDNPEAARHMQAVFAFTEWLKSDFPDVHGALALRNPKALDVVQTVMNGNLAPSNSVKKSPSSASGMAGLGDLVDAQPATDWGKTIVDAAKSLISLKGQNDLIKLNVTRAEQGLPPIDQGAVSPQVNVGVSPQVQQLIVYGIGALVVVGLVHSLSKGK